MTPNYYERFAIGVDEEGEYEEIFNSDKDVYGGYNQYNGLPLKAERGYCFNQPYRLVIKLATFGAMIFKKVVKKETKVEEPVIEKEEVSKRSKDNV